MYHDYLNRPKFHHFITIIGELAALSCDERRNIVVDETQDAAEATPFDGLERNDLFLAELRHFIECVREGRKTAVPISAGLLTQRVNTKGFGGAGAWIAHPEIQGMPEGCLASTPSSRSGRERWRRATKGPPSLTHPYGKESLENGSLKR